VIVDCYLSLTSVSTFLFAVYSSLAAATVGGFQLMFTTSDRKLEQLDMSVNSLIKSFLSKTPSNVGSFQSKISIKSYNEVMPPYFKFHTFDINGFNTITFTFKTTFILHRIHTNLQERTTYRHDYFSKC
jgi:hypothetical protein